MDLRAAEQLNGKLWNGVKLGAFLCFLVAGVLLVTSLFVPPPPHTGNAQLPPAGPSSAAHIQ
jgi:hypothetical protein